MQKQSSKFLRGDSVDSDGDSENEIARKMWTSKLVNKSLPLCVGSVHAVTYVTQN